ncbi:MAG: hypothetical protein AAF602_26495 [Myxococcota bacterium]
MRMQGLVGIVVAWGLLTGCEATKKGVETLSNAVEEGRDARDDRIGDASAGRDNQIYDGMPGVILTSPVKIPIAIAVEQTGEDRWEECWTFGVPAAAVPPGTGFEVGENVAGLTTAYLSSARMNVRYQNPAPASIAPGASAAKRWGFDILQTVDGTSKVTARLHREQVTTEGTQYVDRWSFSDEYRFLRSGERDNTFEAKVVSGAPGKPEDWYDAEFTSIFAKISYRIVEPGHANDCAAE